MRQRRLPPCLVAAVLTAAAVALLLCTSTPGALLFAWTSSASRSRPPPPSPSSTRLDWGPGRPPSFAYWISGTRNDSRRALRLLRAVYHPRNRYLLHLDAAAGRDEREALAAVVRADPAWRAFRNVDVLGEAYAVHRAGGASALAAALHGAAVLLRVANHWDWFVTLSAADYPLVTQDDLLYAFSSVPRDLNFVDHTSDLGWKEHERFEKLIVDPSLYMEANTEPFVGTGTRPMPAAFKIFTGSPWVILSRNFTEHCVHGWRDNLPRKLLLYFANTPYSTESYFQTLICNSPEFRNTTVNGDLRYFVWADPPGLDPLVLDESRLPSMADSGAAFARWFEEDAPVLRRIDDELLQMNRSAATGQVLVPDEVSSSGWRRGGTGTVDSSCLLEWAGDVNAVRPGQAGERLRRRVSSMIQTRGCSAAS